MKSLILKILRGSYPPIRPFYSYDLRNLIAALLKKHPRERPSLESVMRKGFIRRANPLYQPPTSAGPERRGQRAGKDSGPGMLVDARNLDFERKLKARSKLEKKWGKRVNVIIVSIFGFRFFLSDRLLRSIGNLEL